MPAFVILILSSPDLLLILPVIELSAAFVIDELSSTLSMSAKILPPFWLIISSAFDIFVAVICAVAPSFVIVPLLSMPVFAVIEPVLLISELSLTVILSDSTVPLFASEPTVSVVPSTVPTLIVACSIICEPLPLALVSTLPVIFTLPVPAPTLLSSIFEPRANAVVSPPIRFTVPSFFTPPVNLSALVFTVPDLLSTTDAISPPAVLLTVPPAFVTVPPVIKPVALLVSTLFAPLPLSILPVIVPAFDILILSSPAAFVILAVILLFAALEIDELSSILSMSAKIRAPFIFDIAPAFDILAPEI